MSDVTYSFVAYDTYDDELVYCHDRTTGGGTYCWDMEAYREGSLRRMSREGCADRSFSFSSRRLDR